MTALNKNLSKLTVLLSDGEYHDGTSIGKALNITRAAVWKLIKKLEQYDIPISSIKGKGYRLEAPLILLDSNKIKHALSMPSIALTLLEKTDTTNDAIKKIVTPNKKIALCLAETQTQGKGRMGREWHSPFGKNIYLSIRYPFQKEISELSGLSLVIALSIAESIESFLHLKKESVQVKWPNDVLIDHQKISGTLIEINAESHGTSEAIIGIGINVNMPLTIETGITKAWTSLLAISGKYQDRNLMTGTLIQTLINYLKRFTDLGLSAFMKEWQSRDALLNKTITLTSGNVKKTGECIGINSEGHLRLKLKNGSTQAFASGDTTLG